MDDNEDDDDDGGGSGSGKVFSKPGRHRQRLECTYVHLSLVRRYFRPGALHDVSSVANRDISPFFMNDRLMQWPQPFINNVRSSHE